MKQREHIQWSSWVGLLRYPQEQRAIFGFFWRGDARRWKVLQGESEPIVIFSAYAHPETWAFASITRELSQDDTLWNSPLYVVGHRLLELECVKCVYLNFDEEPTVVDVWTILYEANDANRRTVYERELELIDNCPSLLFNFRTADRSGENAPASSNYRRLVK